MPTSGTPTMPRSATRRRRRSRLAPTPDEYQYQWYADGDAIAGAMSATFTPGPDQVGMSISAEVTASKTGYFSALSESDPTAPVAPGDLVNTTGPTVAGTLAVGRTVRVSSGGWSPTPTRVAYQWTSDGEPISGATQASLHVDSAPVVRVFAPGYTAISTRLVVRGKVSR